MRVRIGLETGFADGRCLAWALDFAGACAWGADRSAALISLPKELTGWSAWARRKGGWDWLPFGDLDFRLVEAATAGSMNGVWFADDARSYDRVEAVRASQMLGWVTEDLAPLMIKIEAKNPASHHAALSEAEENPVTDLVSAAERFLAGAGLNSDPSAGTQTSGERLASVTQRARARILDLAGSGRQWEMNGERWSARKLLRMLVWNALHHLAQAQRAA